MNPIGIIVVLAIAAVVSFFFLSLMVRKLLYVAAPNEALVFSGSKRMLNNREVGYRILRGGRSLRLPLLEDVTRIDLTMFTIDVVVQNAYSKGGIPLNVLGVANVKIAGDEPLLNNAAERFLGKNGSEIMRIAKETLEGNLRGVLAQLTPEQVNEDKTRFAQTLIEEAEHDMSRMGLSLETLKIQNVSDDTGYLNSIGRIRGAGVRQSAAIAEASAQADTAVQKATNTMSAEIAKIDADLEIARQQYAKRIMDARTKRTAMIAESQGQVSAEVQKTRAEIERQKARVLQVQRKLDAEVVQPAEAQRKAAEENARGSAQRIIEQGKAQAASLHALIEQYKRSGASAREVLVVQKLLPLAHHISGATQKVAVRKLTVLPKGEEGEGDFAKKAINVTEQLRAATGIDIGQVAKRLGAGAPPPPPPKPND
ncbi:MAG TPA: SPFH domain-containing protein [Polyangiaceae bacterium]|jgi:flotillin|nr:SPFH domain-containing protein [Polyangiaceae bacterium]